MNEKTLFFSLNDGFVTLPRDRDCRQLLYEYRRARAVDPAGDADFPIRGIHVAFGNVGDGSEEGGLVIPLALGPHYLPSPHRGVYQPCLLRVLFSLP